MNKCKVCVVKIKIPKYPKIIPFHPSETYPEYPFSEHISNEKNYVYDGIRKLLYNLDYDLKNFGTCNWNPFGHIIKPSMTVVIKPNFVLSKHFEGKNIFSIITHPAVIRTIADYCWIALKGKGKIIIADAPQYNCNFSELVETTGLDKIVKFYAMFLGPSVELYDLRDYWSKTLHMPSCIRKLPGDPQGSVIVNLGDKSAFYKFPHPEKFYGAVYHRQETIKHHSGRIQEYEISQTILNADVFISVPKLKVHKKVGVTLNNKGLVGICTNKNLLVHYTLGTPKEGGDQLPDSLLTPLEHRIIKFERWMYDTFLSRRSILAECIHRTIYGFFYLKLLKPLGLKVADEKRLLDAGNWYGNDSVWRMVVDLLKIIYFADKEGNLKSTPQRRLFSIIDGVIGGENKGPLLPDPKPAGILIGGENFLAADIVATRLMGFDPYKLKQFSILNDSNYDFGLKTVNDIDVVSDEPDFQKCLKNNADRFFSFKPYPGWIDHIEI